MNAVKVTYTDGTVISTSINGTDEEVLKYFAPGRWFNVGIGERDNLQQVQEVEFIRCRWFRHLHFNTEYKKWYWYDFMADTLSEALKFANNKFVSAGIVGEIAE